MKRSFYQAAVVSILLDANKTAGDEARRQIHQNVASSIEEVLAAMRHKAPNVRPPASHHEN